jgi:soluble lytic murein transglycosylase-like protein
MTDYTGQIVQTAQQYGVDPNLALAVAQQESSLNPDAISSEGAIGLFQLMPATAAGLGVDPHDPLQNITGGVKYLSQLLTQFGGNVSLALAAYNAGPGNVQKYNGIPPFPETQNYVSSILGKLGGSPSAPAPAPSAPTTPADVLGSILDSSGNISPIAIGALALLGLAAVVLVARS